MSTITAVLSADHRHGDQLLGAMMRAAEQGDWVACGQQFDAFLEALKRHMNVEEGVLFPAFEQASGVSGGPTWVMRHEHRRMLAILGEIATVIASRNREEFCALADSFAGVMEAHSLKEERVLYPLCDELLPNISAEALQQMISQP